MKRREFIMLLGGAAAWPHAARAQQPAMPVVAVVNGATAENAARNGTAFRNGISETGYVDGQNVSLEYHWLAGQYERLPALMADLVRRHVAVIATPGFSDGALVAKAATATMPIVFGVGEDPVTLGLVASLARPDGNATGINFFAQEVAAKRLGLLRELVPKAARIALLVNPGSPSTTEPTLKGVREAAGRLGLEISVLNASTVAEVDAAFATLAREPSSALIGAGDPFIIAQSALIIALAARYRLPAIYPLRHFVANNGLMSYGPDTVDVSRRSASYVDRILRGAKPADLPVQQPSKLDLVINLETAKALGLTIPPSLLARADEVIE